VIDLIGNIGLVTGKPFERHSRRGYEYFLAQFGALKAKGRTVLHARDRGSFSWNARARTKAGSFDPCCGSRMG